MKKIVRGICLFMGSILLSGCSLDSLKGGVEKNVKEIIKKDQQHEQGFVLTQDAVYVAFLEEEGYINLRNKGIIEFPDLCTLVKPEDHEDITGISLANNNIRIVDADLSCFINLESLNLSYNAIQAVYTIGSLPNLKELLLHKNEIESLKDFPDFPSLEKLNLGYNKLKEVKDLDHLKKLIVLELQHNVIESIVGVEKLEQLQQLKLEFNKMKEGDLTFVVEQLKKLELFSQ